MPGTTLSQDSSGTSRPPGGFSGGLPSRASSGGESLRVIRSTARASSAATCCKRSSGVSNGSFVERGIVALHSGGTDQIITPGYVCRFASTVSESPGATYFRMAGVTRFEMLIEPKRISIRPPKNAPPSGWNLADCRQSRKTGFPQRDPGNLAFFRSPPQTSNQVGWLSL